MFPVAVTSPPKFKLVPKFKLLANPTPPATVNAPVIVFVETVEPFATIVSNRPIGSIILIKPEIVFYCLLRIPDMP